MRVINLITLVSTIAFLGGCSINRTVTEAETKGFIEYLEAGAKPAFDSLSDVNTWIQPDNKTEACKLIFPEKPDLNKWSKLYWDGACKEGYAYGLGREFTVSKDGKVKSAFGEYLGGPQRPNEYASSDFSANEYFIGDSEEKKFLFVRVNDVENNFDIDVRILNIDGLAVYSKVATLAGEKIVFSKTFNGMDTGYFFETVNHPNGQSSNVFYTKKDGNYVGYSIVNDSNGTTYVGTKDGSWERVNLPESYIARAKMIAAAIEEKIAASEDSVNEAEKVLKRYQAKVCQGNQAPSFLDIEAYGRICGEHGDLSIFDEKAEKVVLRKNEIRQQQLAQEASRQRLAAENAAHQSQEMARLLGGLAEIGSSMNSSSQTSLTQAQTYQSQQPHVTGFSGFGQSNQSKAYGTPVYSESECSGAIVMGRCTGAVIPSGSSREQCYGTVVNGRCIGSQF